MSKRFMAKSAAAVLGIFLLSCPVCFAGASDDLQGMSNTGSSFDGSDGQRSGMDIAVSPSSGEIPEVSAPVPVDPPEPVVQAEPEPTPAPEPVVQAEPEPTPAPEPVIQEEPAPAPEPVVQAEPEPEPVKEGSFNADEQ